MELKSRNQRTGWVVLITVGCSIKALGSLRPRPSHSADPKTVPVVMPVVVGWKDHFRDPFTVGLHS